MLGRIVTLLQDFFMHATFYLSMYSHNVERNGLTVFSCSCGSPILILSTRGLQDDSASGSICPMPPSRLINEPNEIYQRTLKLKQPIQMPT